MQIEVLGERYQLQDPIGRGGMATIYRGRDLRMDRVVAIKVLREVYSTDPKFVTRFQREARAASSLQHPNIVQVYDYGQSDGNYFIVMEMVEGTDLRRYLRSRGMLAIDRAIIIAHDVALGLGAAHRRSIVHRDVKPQNILVGRDGSIKLTDFGIASVYKDINAERLTTTGMTLGTVQYYAPEQAQGEIVSPAADVYALGIVMYEMLTQRTPFDGDTPVAVAMQHIQEPPVPPSQLNPNIPPALEEIILRCLEKVPGMRFPDGSALARALEMLGDEEANNATMISSTGAFAPNSGPTPQVSSPNNGAYVAQSNSSPNNMMAPEYMNGGQENGLATLRNDQPYTYSPQQAPVSGADYNQLPYSAPDVGSSGVTRPFQKGAMGRAGVVGEQRDSRFASVITILILLATLLLLGFSVYLAAELNFINIPGISGGQPTATTPQTLQVPQLVGKSLKDAQDIAGKNGFTLRISNGMTSGTVTKQDPAAGAAVPANSTISIDLAEATPTVTVPNDLVGKSLGEAEKILSQTQYANCVSLQVVGVNANLRVLPEQIVKDVQPKAGTSLKCDPNQPLVLLVDNSVPTQTVPTPTPSPTPSPTPTDEPSPTPTRHPKPTRTPKPDPTVTVSPGDGSAVSTTPGTQVTSGTGGNNGNNTNR